MAKILPQQPASGGTKQLAAALLHLFDTHPGLIVEGTAPHIAGLRELVDGPTTPPADASTSGDQAPRE